MYVCNRETYGHIPAPLHTQNSLRDEADNFLHTLLEVMGEFLCDVLTLNITLESRRSHGTECTSSLGSQCTVLQWNPQSISPFLPNTPINWALMR